METFSSTIPIFLKDNGAKGICFDAWNAKVEAPEGYLVKKLIPMDYYSLGDLGVV